VEPLERVRSALTDEYRSASELAQRCDLPVYTVAGALGQLRRRGEAEFVNRARFAVWRRPAGQPVDGSNST
jgi:hypothetical protein